MRRSAAKIAMLATVIAVVAARAATCVQTGEPWFDREGLEPKWRS